MSDDDRLQVSESGVGPWGSDPAPLSDDLFAHELMLAQMEAVAAATERVSAAWASLEFRIDRLASSLVDIEDRLRELDGQTWDEMPKAVTA